MLKRSLFYLGIFLIVSILFNSCGDGSSAQNGKAWFYENEFTKDGKLYAKIEDTILLNIGPSQQLGGSEEHIVRYEYKESGEYVFCIDSNEKYIKKMALHDENNNILLLLKKGDRCKNIYLNAGKYGMQITHDASKVPKEGTVAFIHYPANTLKAKESSEAKTKLTASSNPPYYALQVAGGSYDGQYLAAKNMDFRYYYNDPQGPPYIYPAQRDFLAIVSGSDHSNFKEKRHLFSFEEKKYIGKVIEGYNWESYAVLGQGNHIGICDPSSPPLMWTEDSDHFFCVDSQKKSDPLEVPTMVFMSMLEHWPRSAPDHSAKAVPYNMQMDLLLKSENTDQTYTLWNDSIAFVLDSSALYASENTLMYRTVSSKGPRKPTQFKIDRSMPLYKDGSKYELKANEVAFSGSCGLKGPTYIVGGDISDIPKIALLAMPQIKSIKFGSSETNIIFFAQKEYGDWQFTMGMDEICLEKPLDFTAGSLKILNAKKVFLSSHQCDYCDLSGADFSNISLDHVSLRYADMTNVQFNNSKLEKADMRYAKLYGANLSYSDLSGSTMCGAFLNGNILSGNRAATLTGAYMKNVNLSKSNLNGASFAFANFYSETSVGCIPTDCNMTSCASAAGATLDNANFNNAYLDGTDFSSSTVSGTIFTNAVLVGARFKDAKIDRDKDTGASANFSGAFIQGADFSDATVANTNFTSAYVDLENANGSLMFFKLNGSHSEFAGWSPLGDPVCTASAYSAMTVTPATDNTCTCPDGSSGSCDAVWKDSKVPMDKSPQPASYYTDPNPVCNNPVW